MKVFHKSDFAMATRINLLLPNIDEQYGNDLYTKVMDEIVRVEALLSCFDTNSEIYRINRDAFESDIVIDKEMFNLLKLCQEVFLTTNKKFDVTISALKSFNKEKKIIDLLPKFGADKYHLNKDKSTIRFENKYIKIDLGAIGKGYALKRVESILKKHNTESGIVSFGESSILAIGSHPVGEYWPISIDNPSNDERGFKMKNSSLSVSGVNLENYKKTQDFEHLINPQNAKVDFQTKLCCVHARCPVEAEILSTCLFLMDETEFIKTTNIFKHYIDHMVFC
jgi:thiamine biosynthesis lipoprotein